MMMTDPDIDMGDKPPDVGQANQTEDDSGDAKPRSLRIHSYIIATTNQNCLVIR